MHTLLVEPWDQALELVCGEPVLDLLLRWNRRTFLYVDDGVANLELLEKTQYDTILYYTILYYTILYYTIRYYAIRYYNTIIL